ncbi:MAG TPA: cation-translocating P-type ATPase [Bacteroidia bacterium]|nr:cation-translocating P-type ATPase [Bacteroidia bacterium]
MPERTTINVEGMTCASCAMSITRLLEKKGLKEVNVNVATGEVAFADGNISLTEITSGINNLGYNVVKKSEGGVAAKEKGLSALEKKFLIALGFTIPLLAHMVFHWKPLHHPLVQMILCIPVIIIGLSHFGKSALASLKHGIPNMDVLIALGSTMAFIYSVFGMILYNGSPDVQKYLFFETAATIITFVLLGNIIEKRSLKQTTSAIEELSKLQPLTAKKINDWGTAKESVADVPVNRLLVHDLLLINTGDQVPADGKIFWGHAGINESMLTGESTPAEKGINDTVLAGSIVVNGSIKIFAEKVGKQTVLSNVIELVKAAQSSKPEIQRIGDKVSAWFVPAVLVVSLITFIVSKFFIHASLGESVMRSIAVLVVSCPCAMGLATPTAVSVGIGRAARNGILVRGGAILEVFRNVNTIVFDKTGTLTNGKFIVKKIKCFEEEEKNIKQMIYHLEKYSSHPVATALANAFETEVKDNETIIFHEVEEQKGFGIKAKDKENNEFLLVSYAIAQNFTPDSGHSVYLIRNNKLIATIDLEDEVRPGAAEMISELKKLNIKPVLLSGDTAAKCKELADRLGIEEVYSGQLPHQKMEVINKLKQNGTVAMVGDGINDAPSLAGADVGISLGNASKIAISSAQIILLNTQEMKSLINALKISRATILTIKQNLFWAFLYNVLTIPVAAAGYLSPIIGSLSMAFSDVIVIGNSVRLKYRRL